MPIHFLFVDDAVGPNGDAERYRQLLSGGELRVTATGPSRSKLLVREDQLEPPDLAGFILDINLADQVEEGQDRFLGSGAGLAQDIRLLQGVEGSEGQRPRPIVRLCASQVFQKYIAGDNSTADIFDLGFDKETIGDLSDTARMQIASLPDIYEGMIGIQRNAASAKDLLALETQRYQELHSLFRGSFEQEIEKKVHEAVNFMLSEFLLQPGLLISEQLLDVRLGIELRHTKNDAWQSVLDSFDGAKYRGKGSTGFPRWWMNEILTQWAAFSDQALFKLTAEERITKLGDAGFVGLAPIVSTPESPGDRPWAISQSDAPELRIPVDPMYGYPLAVQTRAWLDEPLWCLEQARQQRRSRLLSKATVQRLLRDLKAKSRS